MHRRQDDNTRSCELWRGSAVFREPTRRLELLTCCLLNAERKGAGRRAPEIFRAHRQFASQSSPAFRPWRRFTFGGCSVHPRESSNRTRPAQSEELCRAHFRASRPIHRDPCGMDGGDRRARSGQIGDGALAVIAHRCRARAPQESSSFPPFRRGLGMDGHERCPVLGGGEVLPKGRLLLRRK
jgi:hypothetical protein